MKSMKIQTLTTMSPKSSAQQVRTPSGIVELVDKLLDKHIYSEIAELLNENIHCPRQWMPQSDRALLSAQPAHA